MLRVRTILLPADRSDCAERAYAPAAERAASFGATLRVVMATHGRRGIRRFLMGSAAEELVRIAPCPVLTIHTGGRSLLPEGAEAPRALDPA